MYSYECMCNVYENVYIWNILEMVLYINCRLNLKTFDFYLLLQYMLSYYVL